MSIYIFLILLHYILRGKYFTLHPINLTAVVFLLCDIAGDRFILIRV